MGQKYHDKEWLRKHYVDENMSDSEIAEICGVHRSTICRWMKRHGIKIDMSKTQTNQDKPYTNSTWLEEKYWEEELTVHEMADEADCSAQTIVNWMDKYGIDKRTVRQNIGVSKVTQMTTNGEFGKIPGGYIQFQSYIVEDGEYNYSVCGSHQLLAIAEGADPHRVFSNGENVVHHENGLKWDNRPENLMVMSGAGHTSYHTTERHSPKE